MVFLLNRHFKGYARLREIDKWPKRFKYRKLSKLVIIICFFLSIAIIGLSYYGSNVGNFLINIEDNARRHLSLSEDAAFTNPVTILSADGLNEMMDTTLSYIPYDIDLYDGANNDPQKRYIAYTFYVRNISTLTIRYLYEIKINSVSKNVDSAVRVMVIRNGQRTIYAKWPEVWVNGRWVRVEDHDATEPNENLQGESLYSVTNFKFANKVCEVTGIISAPGQTDKFTVVIWLEGWDPQCTDDIKGGTLRMEMLFAVE